MVVLPLTGSRTVAREGPCAKILCFEKSDSVIKINVRITLVGENIIDAEAPTLAPERYKVQFTVGRGTYEKLRRVQDLLRHRVPNGDPAVIFERAIALLLKDLETKKIATTERPRHSKTVNKHSRHIPAGIRRTVWARDGGRCNFEGPHGRCSETGFLEFHHVVPYADGGATTAENLELRCAAHNRYEAEQYFGRGFPMFVREERERRHCFRPTLTVR